MKAGIDKWEEWDFRCHKCDWEGQGSQLSQGEMSGEGCEEVCPKCSETIAWLEFPMAEEMMANFDRLTPTDRAMAVVISDGHKTWEASKLKSIDQLPDIKEEYLVLVWDEDPKTQEIIIRHGPDVIFRQVGSWEYYDFFVSALRVLKSKYGYRLMDVIPTPAAQAGIAGDSLTASNRANEMRRLIGLDCWRNAQKTEERERWKTYGKQHDH